MNKLNYLDILFDRKNKSYGAYELRKNYTKRMLIALLLTFIIALCMVFYLFLFKKIDKKKIERIHLPLKEIILEDIHIEEEIEQPKLPPPPSVPKKVEEPKEIKKPTVKFTTPKVVEDKEIQKKQDNIANQNELKEHLIDTKKQEGEAISSSNENNTKDQPSPIYKQVDVSAKYPGNWVNFLERNLEYPQELKEKGIGGVIKISFIVDIEGLLSDIKVISGPEELREICIRAIKKSGRWIPAQKNGIKVKAYKLQAIRFELEEEE